MIELSQAKKGDFEFYFNLRKENQIYDSDGNQTWNDELQRNILIRHFYPKRYLIITTTGRKVGIVTFFIARKSIQIRNLIIAPKFRSKGIATRVIQKAILISNEQQKPLFAQAVKSNKRILRILLRLGFVITEEHETHYIMKYNK